MNDYPPEKEASRPLCLKPSFLPPPPMKYDMLLRLDSHKFLTDPEEKRPPLVLSAKTGLIANALAELNRDGDKKAADIKKFRIPASPPSSSSNSGNEVFELFGGQVQYSYPKTASDTATVPMPAPDLSDASPNIPSPPNMPLPKKPSSSTASSSLPPSSSSSSSFFSVFQKAVSKSSATKGGDGGVNFGALLRHEQSSSAPREVNKRPKIAKDKGINDTSSKIPQSSSSSSSKFWNAPSSMVDLAGIENVVTNIVTSDEAVNSLMNLVETREVCAFAVAFAGQEKTSFSNHSTSTKKYCSGDKATRACLEHWNCKCDKQVRAKIKNAPILGVFVSFESANLNEHEVSKGNEVHMIPLGEDSSVIDDLNKEWRPPQSHGLSNLLPISCSLSCSKRHEVVRYILGANIMKIGHNLQTALLPLIYRLDSLQQYEISRGFVGSDHSECIKDIKISNLFDVKCASSFLNSDLTEEEQELENTARRLNWPINANDFYGENYSKFGTTTALIQLLCGELKFLHYLHGVLSLKLHETGATNVFRSLEMKLLRMLSEMELRGTMVNPSKMDEMQEQIVQKIELLTSKAYELAGKTFNANSPEQVAEILYSHLQLPPPSSSSKGGKHLSTSEEDLSLIIHVHPIVGIILDLRALSKLNQTFIEGLRPHIVKTPATSMSKPLRDKNAFEMMKDNSQNGNFEYRVHAQFHQTTVRTGRLSCTKPNLQQIPKEQIIAGMSFAPRNFFIPSPKKLLVAADYSQIEVRLLAHFSRDSKLQEIFTGTPHGDIYKNLGARIFKKPAANVNETERKKAKTVTLGLIYGMGAELMAKKLSIDRSEAKMILEAFFAEFRQVQVWMKNVKDQARTHGFVTTLTGRRRIIANMRSPNHEARAYAERQAVNSIIQGTASDLIKVAMLEFELCLHHSSASQIINKQDVDMLMQVHDELIFEVDERIDLIEFTNLLQHSMSTIVCRRLFINIPMPIDVKFGKSWGSMSNYEVFAATEYHDTAVSKPFLSSEDSSAMDIDHNEATIDDSLSATKILSQSTINSRSID